MRAARSVTVIVIVLLTSGTRPRAQGPIARSIDLEAHGLAGAASPPGAPDAADGWPNVMRLQPAAPLIITVDGGGPETRQFVHADGSSLVVLNLTPISSREGQRALLDFTSSYAEDLVSADRSITTGSLRLEAGGVFVQGRKVAERDEIIVTIPRRQIVEISVQDPRAGSKALAGLGGGLGGFLLGAIVGNVVGGPCQCGDRGLQGAVVGSWIGAGLGAFAAAQTVRPELKVIYPRPAVSP